MVESKNKGYTSQEEVVNYLKSEFKTTDNFSRNIKKENAKIKKERASLLIHAGLQMKEFSRFVRKNNVRNAWDFKLKNPIIIDIRGHKITFDSFVLNSKEFECAHLKTKMHQNKTQDYSIEYGTGYVLSDHEIQSAIYEAENIFSKYSLSDLMISASTYKSIDAICHFWKNDSSPFEPLKLSTGALLARDIFHDQESRYSKELEKWRRNYLDSLEEVIVNDLVEYCYEQSSRSLCLNQAYEKCYDDWFKKVYSFKDETGNVVQKVIKNIDGTTFEKTLIPCTSWFQNNIAQNRYFNVPLPKKQILYNLDLLTEDTTNNVILTNSIEIADANQKHSPTGTIWTSWLCNDYACVDWSPISKEKLNIYYLIVNHSDKSLEESYVEAGKLAEFLKKEYKINMTFIQSAIDYNEPARHRQHLNSFPDILEYRKQFKPFIIEDGFLLMESFEDFQKMYNKVLDSLNFNLSPFYQEKADTEQTNETEKGNSSHRLEAIDYLARPAIIRGDAIMLHSPPKHCKTVFNYSLCASIISRKKIFTNKWWTVPASDYKWNKVLYLDFEMGKDRFENCKPKFIYPYFPSDPQQKQECEANFIHKDLKKDSTNYSDPVNHQKILDKIEEAKTEGIKGQPVDLLVIDTYTKFVKSENTMTWSKIEPLINKIIAQGIAVLIVDHSDDTGNIRGYKEKLKSLTGQIIITMDKKDIIKKNAEDFRNIYIHDNRDSHVGVDNEPFKINFKNGKWNAYKTEKDENDKYIEADTDKEFKEITDAYKDHGYRRDEVLKMMNIKKSQYSKLRNL